VDLLRKADEVSVSLGGKIVSAFGKGEAGGRGRSINVEIEKESKGPEIRGFH